jgi:translation initiation factor 2D
MTPGLTGWSSDIKPGDVTAITLQDAVPIAVGVAAFEIGRLSKAAGEKGKAVYLVHCYNDELWGLGTKTRPPVGTSTASAHIEGATQRLSVQENKEGDEDLIHVVENPSEIPVESQIENDKVEPSTAGLFFFMITDLEIDGAFKAASIFGLYKVRASDAQNAVSLPLTSSTFISSYLNPYLPEMYTQYNFKKTSWKKAAAFLKKYLEKEGVIKTKDRGGETVILSINWNHNLIVEFQPYHLGNKDAHNPGVRNGPSSTAPTHMMQVRELFKPHGKAFKALLESLSISYNLTLQS